MYYFEAHYVNMNDDTEVTRKIQFDGQFFNSEKDCFVYAMDKAYDMAEKNECLASVEFIAC